MRAYTHFLHATRAALRHGTAAGVFGLLATTATAGAAALLLSAAPAQAQATAAPVQLTLSGVRPEALSWFWDNADQGLLSNANNAVRAFRWIEPPATPQHLGYSAGARHETVANFGGATHTVLTTYLAPDTVRSRVASDNFLGAKPYSFLAAEVAIDGQAPFTLLIQYKATGNGFGDTQLRIEAGPAADPALAQAYADYLVRTFKGLQSGIMDALDQRYFNGVLKQRGYYSIGEVDSKRMVTLTIVQDIRGITPDMLAWWWDHIGNTERYRLWQPIDHVSFEWSVPPINPDHSYDVGAVQKVKEYVGPLAMTLSIKGADPQVLPPPVPITDPGHFYASTNIWMLKGLLPDNSLVHQWRPNSSGDGVVLTSTFVNTSMALLLNRRFFHDLGSHGLREFQMLPYFLPRLYKREQLGQ